MNNCFILGSGRSGTSMAAGVLGRSGYFMGDRPYPTDDGNPKGYFEDFEVNDINEELLLEVHPLKQFGPIRGVLTRNRLKLGQRWLAPVPLSSTIHSSPLIDSRILALTEREPFCFKDPRFSFTLGAWRRLAWRSVCVCVFRDPGLTANSIITEWNRSPYLHNIPVNRDYALAVWESVYSHILQKHYVDGGTWLFLHYNQFLDGSAVEKLETALEADVDRGFVDPSLKRSTNQDPVPDRVASLYDQLCELANYDDAHRAAENSCMS